jgi:branched-chain amino acid transport system permease protein
MPTASRPRFLTQLLALLLAASTLPWMLSSYFVHVYTIGWYYVILAASWNLLAGYTGQFSLAHHAFAAMGGYTSALLVLYTPLPLPIGILAALLLTGIVGYLLGTLCLNMRRIYLALATWAFAESLRLFIAAEYTFTRGDLGLSTPPLFASSQPTPYFYLFLVLAGLSLWVLYEILRSRIGFYLRSIRDDEEAALAMGVNTVRWKRFAFAVSSMLAGVAGAFYGHYIGLLSPVSIKFNEMAIIIIMVITGGLRSFWGQVVGALFIQVLSEYLRDYGEIRMVLFAVLVIVLLRLYQGGLFGLLQALTRQFRPLVKNLAKYAGYEPTR